MDEINDSLAQDQASEKPFERVAPPTSRFMFVDVAALRAKQLRRGARPRISESDVTHLPHKPERVAMEEVRQGFVPFDLPAPKPAPAEEQA